MTHHQTSLQVSEVVINGFGCPERVWAGDAPIPVRDRDAGPGEEPES